MARRSFSFMLAWRYLNPRRAMLSAVTLISVTGVLLGVWILIVVMSVFNGLEKEVKERLLGYAPHIKLMYAPQRDFQEAIPDWREATQLIAKMPHVKSASPYIQDYTFMDVEGRHNPGLFRAVDTEDPDQVAGLEKLLDLKNYPGGSGDLGLERKVVISSHVAKGFGIRVGDKIKLYSTSNLQQIQQPYDLVNLPLVRERYKDQIATARDILGAKLEHRGGQLFLPQAQYEKLVEFSDLFGADQASIRDEERDLLIEFFQAVGPSADADDGKLLEEEQPGLALEALKKLDATDKDAMDLKTLKGIRELVLPQEVTVAGVFNPGQMAVMPDVFMPIGMAQQLSGRQDEVQAIAVRVDDSYDAEPIARQILQNLPPGWVATTWWAEFGDFAKLIAQQRVMMYIVMSMIIVISAFSMMAVMFTVTLQKRREIGVMKALGAAPGQIVWVFLHQGVILGVVGAIAGAGLALATLPAIGKFQDLMRQWFGFDPFSEAFNGFSSLPYQVIPVHVVIVIVAAFLLCCLAAMIPAMRAARSDAAKSLRNL